jgi:hypothetical protein
MPRGFIKAHADLTDTRQVDLFVRTLDKVAIVQAACRKRSVETSRLQEVVTVSRAADHLGDVHRAAIGGRA